MSVWMVVVVTDMHVAGFRGSESELCCCTQACLKCWNFTDVKWLSLVALKQCVRCVEV